MKEVLSGNEAVARGAWESGAKFASAYPGTPSTEILENVVKYKEIISEWAPNEKVAFEVAMGASMAGARSLVAMKHVGVNVAADPLMTWAYTGVNGGFVLVSADDPGMHSSQNEQDNRTFARFAKIPMLEPSDSREARDFTSLAFELSEEFDTPVLLRMTTRTCHAKGVVDLKQRHEVGLKPYRKQFHKFVMLPAHARPRRLLVEERMRKLAEYAETSPLNFIEHQGDRALGVITSGVAYQYVREAAPQASVLKLGLTNPLPLELIRRFCTEVEKVVVVEELDPVLEEQIRAAGLAVHGHDLVPNIGELNTDIVRRSLNGGGSLPAPATAASELPGRPPVLCPGCPHRGIFYALRKLRCIVTGDIGCYTLGASPPLKSMDSCICMGASIGMGLGMTTMLEDEKLKNRVVATLGDSTFIHSGITGLVEAVYNHRKATIVILDNSITAMTGHQENPASGKSLSGQPAPQLDLEALCRACGVEHVRVINPLNLEQTLSTLREELAYDGISVIITRYPCIIADRSVWHQPLEVNTEVCDSCGVCFKVACPGLEKDQQGDKTRINPLLCIGCQACLQACKQGAIQIRNGQSQGPDRQ
jgi:indolepyruvate ferredoxin oxidoreductase alpha subunit